MRRRLFRLRPEGIGNALGAVIMLSSAGRDVPESLTGALGASHFANRHAAFLCKGIDVPAVVTRVRGKSESLVFLPPRIPGIGIAGVGTNGNVALEQSLRTADQDRVFGTQVGEHFVEEFRLVKSHSKPHQVIVNLQELVAIRV